MTCEQTSELESGDIEVPESAVLQVLRPSGYGSVPGLDEEELAEPAELERQVFLEEWGPVLQLPEPARWSGPRPERDESGAWDWGAFGTVDFLRDRPAFDKARYKAARLQEELRNALSMFGMVQERLSVGQRVAVLQRISSGVDDPAEFSDADERGYARWYLRARAIRRELRDIAEYRQAGWR
jgi:hypothetical protein